MRNNFSPLASVGTLGDDPIVAKFNYTERELELLLDDGFMDSREDILLLFQSVTALRMADSLFFQETWVHEHRPLRGVSKGKASRFIDVMQEESGVVHAFGLSHIAIVTDCECVDILCYVDPMVSRVPVTREEKERRRSENFGKPES